MLMCAASLNWTTSRRQEDAHITNYHQKKAFFVENNYHGFTKEPCQLIVPFQKLLAVRDPAVRPEIIATLACVNTKDC